MVEELDRRAGNGVGAIVRTPTEPVGDALASLAAAMAIREGPASTLATGGHVAATAPEKRVSPPPPQFLPSGKKKRGRPSRKVRQFVACECECECVCDWVDLCVAVDVSVRVCG